MAATTILVIDDSEPERGVVRKLLELEGYAVCAAASGDEGLAQFRERQPALVLCDLMLPGRSGFDTVRAIRAHNPDACIVAVSGTLFGVAEHETMIKRLGLAGVVEKPFRPAKLLEIVLRALQAGR